MIIAMKTNSGSVWSFLMLCGVLIAVGARGECDNNSINYAGTYKFFALGRSTVDEKGNATRVDDIEALFQIFAAPPNSAGSQEYSYWIKSWNGDTVNISSPDPVLEAGIAADEFLSPADKICVAPPFESAGLQCVDLEDPGMFRITPLEVDANCNLIKVWGPYLEPKTPGCEDKVCFPFVAYMIWIRQGSETTESISLTNSNSGGSRYSYHAFIALMLLLVYSML